jgi:hypothetical protein
MVPRYGFEVFNMAIVYPAMAIPIYYGSLARFAGKGNRKQEDSEDTLLRIPIAIATVVATIPRYGTSGTNGNQKVVT